jgi:RNA polymerase sigma factor (sigma-70 family)
MRVIARPSRLPAFAAAADPRPDAVLLARFILHADEGAFAALVQRHTALVRAVCGGWLRCAADIDDATQATFLVLVKRAGTIRDPAKVGSWLCRTAVYVARRLKKQLGRSAPLVADVPDRDTPEPDGRAEAVAAEVSRLPENYRLAVQLHYAAGLSTTDIAERLGWPKGTVLTRLDRGRKLIERRLLARGITAGVLLSAGALGGGGVSAGWVSDTARAAVALAAGLPAGGATDRAVSLSQGVVNAMTWTKVRVLVAVLMLTIGLGGFALGQWATDKPKKADAAGEKVAVAPPKADEAAPTKPAKPDEGKPAAGRRREAVIKLPTGTFVKEVEVAPYGSGRLSWTFEDERILGKIEASIPVMGIDLELHTEAEYSLSSNGTIYGVVTGVKVVTLKVNDAILGGGKGEAEEFKMILGMVKLAEPLIAEMFTDLPFSYQFRLSGDRLVILNYRTLLAGPNPLMKIAPLLDGAGDTLGGLAEATMYFQVLSTAMEGTYTATDPDDEQPKKKPLVTKKK